MTSKSEAKTTAVEARLSTALRERDLMAARQQAQEADRKLREAQRRADYANDLVRRLGEEH